MSKKNGYRPPRSVQQAQEEKLIESLRAYIRANGAAYLEDPNVSSVGIGYLTNDAGEGRLGLQFTVDRKAELESLDALGTEPLPESVIVDGIEVPTQVVERSYAPQYEVLAEGEAEPPDRKKRLDPVVPGASVGNIRIAVGTLGSAGTIGCIVYDRRDGTPYVLSNWHVLHTPIGLVGDECVQPGCRDDNRVLQNRIGTLARSHVGTDGDCAVASLSGRRFDPAILGLGVVPTRLGVPALGDKVVKSGRTTGVTHGVVRRIDVLSKINYGGTVGPQRIGCFEIGVDPDFPPPDGEISQRGDSGAVWMFTEADGTPTDVLAGLHFGGEGDGNRDEFALACPPGPVFAKLEIGLTPPPPAALEALGEGYDPGFLMRRIQTPELHPKIENDAVRVDGSEVIHHTHFSLAQSVSRRFAFWVAWNVDGGTLRQLDRAQFKLDPKVPSEHQVDNELYRNKNGRINRLDRGHIARRADVIWGNPAEARKANSDSFFYTNITPQMDDFNQSTRNGLWGRLEDAVFEEVNVDDLRISVFGGPVFQDDDRLFRGVRIPREYWKVIVYSEQGDLRAKAFLLTQSLEQIEALDLDEFRTFQVTITELEERTHLRFDPEMHDADTLAAPESLADRAPLDSLVGIWG
ncbi:DNA/RNA non-specific endonuclease [Kitasatospora sp. NPDC054939]